MRGEVGISGPEKVIFTNSGQLQMEKHSSQKFILFLTGRSNFFRFFLLDFSAIHTLIQINLSKLNHFYC